jgi:tetratricopeptide (TPR) repeat protein
MKKDSTLLAERLYTDALQENKQNEEVYINLIQIKLGLKKYQDVIQLARQWQSVNPENDMAYVYEGIASAYGGNFESALNQLLRAIQINPDNYQAYSILAQLYNQKGDKQNAQFYYNKSEEVKQKLQGQ